MQSTTAIVTAKNLHLFFIHKFLRFSVFVGQRRRGTLFQHLHQRRELLDGQPVLADDAHNIRVFQLQNLLVQGFESCGQRCELFRQLLALLTQLFKSRVQNILLFALIWLLLR